VKLVAYVVVGSPGTTAIDVGPPFLSNAFTMKVPDGVFLICAIFTGPLASEESLYLKPMLPIVVQPDAGMLTHWPPPVVS